jgi:hypothetical protein
VILLVKFDQKQWEKTGKFFFSCFTNNVCKAIIFCTKKFVNSIWQTTTFHYSAKVSRLSTILRKPKTLSYLDSVLCSMNRPRKSDPIKFGLTSNHSLSFSERFRRNANPSCQNQDDTPATIPIFFEWFIFLKFTQWQCILCFDNSTAMFKDPKTLHPGGIRTRDTIPISLEIYVIRVIIMGEIVPIGSLTTLGSFLWNVQSSALFVYFYPVTYGYELISTRKLKWQKRPLFGLLHSAAKFTYA